MALLYSIGLLATVVRRNYNMSYVDNYSIHCFLIPLALIIASLISFLIFNLSYSIDSYNM
jgi:hypothetical protein